MQCLLIGTFSKKSLAKACLAIMVSGVFRDIGKQQSSLKVKPIFVMAAEIVQRAIIVWSSFCNLVWSEHRVRSGCSSSQCNSTSRWPCISFVFLLPPLGSGCDVPVKQNLSQIALAVLCLMPYNLAPSATFLLAPLSI